MRTFSETALKNLQQAGLRSGQLKKDKYELRLKDFKEPKCSNPDCTNTIPYNKRKNKYCGRSCAVKINNKIPKRKGRAWICTYCLSPVKRGRKYCDTCRDQPSDNISIGELRGSAKYQRSAQIRDHARKVYGSSSLPKECLVCGYSVHIEICHREPIRNFDETTTLNVVNNLSNLVPLCRNHHWEFDNEILHI